MNIIGYTYEADSHCIECTVKRYRGAGFFCKQNGWERTAKVYRPNYGGGVDDNGIPFTVHDSKDNLVRPLFARTEWWNSEVKGIQFLNCGTCHGVMDVASATFDSGARSWVNNSWVNEILSQKG